MRPSVALVVAGLVVLAGCSAGDSTSTTVPAPTATSVPTTPSNRAPTNATSTEPPPPSYDNPWNASVIKVAVENPAGRSYDSQVRTALQWWEANADDHLAYEDVRFEVIDNPYEAHIEIVFATDITGCTGSDGVVGCAPFPNGGEFSTAVTQTVEIKRGYTNRSTTTIIKHELGHTLGLHHVPQPSFMASENRLKTLPQRDAVDKANPWAQSDISVYVDRSAVPAGINDTVRTEMDHVFTYFNNGGEGATPPNATLTRGNSRTTADIVVEVVRSDDIDGRDTYVTGHWYGIDPDDDGRLETVTNATIRVAYNVRTEDGYVGWATGYYVAASLQATYEDLPPPWSDDGITYEDEWWTRGDGDAR